MFDYDGDMDLGAVSTAVADLYAAFSAPSVASSDGTSRPAGSLDASRPSAGLLGADALLTTVEQAQRVINICGGIQARAMAHLAAHEEVRDDEDASGWTWKRHGLGFVADDTASLVADRLGVSVPVADRRVEDAVHQVTVTPRLVDAMGSGALDQFRAHLVTREVRDCDDETAATIVERLVTRAAEDAPWNAKASADGDTREDHDADGHLEESETTCPSRGWDETAGPMASRTRRLVQRLAPEVAAAQKERAVTDRCLTRRAISDAADQWHGLVPVEQSLVMWQAVDHLARELQGADPALTLDQARVDAMQQLILQQADVTIHLHATHPAEAPAAATSTPDRSDRPIATATDRPARSAPVRRARLAERDSSGVVELGGLNRPGTTTVALDRLPARVRLVDSTTLTCHPDTGALVSGDVPKSLAPTARRIPTDAPTGSKALGEEAEERYRPSPALQRLVRLRDGHCRFPGCRVAARSCDLDHVTAWPTGPTAATNLICLCRRHHRVKQRPGWTVRLDPDGVVHWTDPGGRRTTTAPVDHLDRVLHLDHVIHRDEARSRRAPSLMTPTSVAGLLASRPASLHSLAELTLARLLEIASIPVVPDEHAPDTAHPVEVGTVEWQFGPSNAVVAIPTTHFRPPRSESGPPPF